jgi:hypothetical protein
MEASQKGLTSAIDDAEKFIDRVITEANIAAPVVGL